jgi:hypothetical protein
MLLGALFLRVVVLEEREVDVCRALCEAVKTVCNEAWEHLNHQQGNVGEASKKAECWESF